MNIRRSSRSRLSGRPRQQLGRHRAVHLAAHTPAITASSAVAPRTGGLIRISFANGRLFCASTSSPGKAQDANTAPNAAAAPLISKVSTRNCRTMRARDAPSATRKPISRQRPVTLTRTRPTTFAHATSSSNPTAPSSVWSDERDAPTMSSRSPMAVRVHAASAFAG
jgi:hypothetical protein